VGWITKDGEYVDVTDAITPAQSDFSDAVRQVDPQFGTDGMFYFADVNAGEIEKVDPDNLSPVAVQKVEAWDGDQWFDVYPSGTVSVHLPGFYSQHVENIKPGVFGVGRVEDWLDAKTMLTSDDEDVDNLINHPTSQVYTSTAFTKITYKKAEAEGDYVAGGGSCIAVKAILPSTSTRRNWNPIASPDGKQVAFLSSKIGGSAPELFIVSRDGGDPLSVPTDYSFVQAGEADYELQLLAWFP